MKLSKPRPFVLAILVMSPLLLGADCGLRIVVAQGTITIASGLSTQAQGHRLCIMAYHPDQIGSDGLPRPQGQSFGAFCWHAPTFPLAYREGLWNDHGEYSTAYLFAWVDMDNNERLTTGDLIGSYKSNPASCTSDGECVLQNIEIEIGRTYP